MSKPVSYYQVYLKRPTSLPPDAWVPCSDLDVDGYDLDDSLDSRRHYVLHQFLGHPSTPGYRRGLYYVYIYEYVDGTTMATDGSGPEKFTEVVFFVNSLPYVPEPKDDKTASQSSSDDVVSCDTSVTTEKQVAHAARVDLLLERFDAISGDAAVPRGVEYAVDRALWNLLRRWRDNLPELDENFHRNFRCRDITDGDFTDMAIWHLLEASKLFWVAFKEVQNL